MCQICIIYFFQKEFLSVLWCINILFILCENPGVSRSYVTFRIELTSFKKNDVNFCIISQPSMSISPWRLDVTWNYLSLFNEICKGVVYSNFPKMSHIYGQGFWVLLSFCPGVSTKIEVLLKCHVWVLKLQQLL